MGDLVLKVGHTTLAEAERKLILATVETAPNQGMRQRVAYAAKVLKIGQSTIYRKLNEYQVAKHR